MVSLSNHSEFIALLKSIPAGCPVYEGSVPNSPSFPYVLVNRVLPTVSHRAISRAPQARVTRWRLTVSGLSDASASIIADQCQSALEGVLIGGQRVEETLDVPEVYEDLDVTLTNGTHPLVTKQEWRVMH